ncbi:MAG: dihydroorotate oxidase [Candidatus Levybacteria bacterium]|nr:dihydroorotate oxidase [Candidatus Levybacteria bacterium]
MNAPFYDIFKSYEENYSLGPLGLKKLKRPIFKKTKPKYSFLGLPINLPFGIPAGPLLNSKFIKSAFDFGFSVSVYKTVRGDIFPCHPFPNVLYVKTPKELHPRETPRLTAVATSPLSGSVSITNSFGVPSKRPKDWQQDVKKAKTYERKGQLLVLSFMGTVRKNQTQQEFIEDFVKAGRLASQTHVKALEANLSCPNIGNEGLVCYNLDATEKICRLLRKAIGNTPLILKVGYYKNSKDIEKIAEITQKYANAISSINTLQVEVVDRDGKQALPGPNRLKSGVCGSAIKWAGLRMVKKLNKIRKVKKYTFEIIGVGGVMTPYDYFEYRKAGADLVQSATGAMWNPYLAYQIWKHEL